MKSPSSRKPRKQRKAHHVAACGRAKVPVYRRRTPQGNFAFMVANYAEGKRRFDSYADEALAIEAAGNLARKLSEREVLAAAMTNEQASEYAAAVQKLAPFKVGLLSAADTVAECLKQVGDMPNLHAAVKFYLARHKSITAKRLPDVVAELLKVKEARDASPRYMEDLRYRLNRFAESFQKNAGDVTTAEIQAWFDEQKLPPQSYSNFRRVVHLLFKFAVARGYACDNPLEGVERVKVRGGDVEIFTPTEIARLLAVASAEFLPSLALGAFAGLRSAEVERLEWSDIHFAEKCIVVGASRSKTATRRVVPVSDNLAEWLAPYVKREGKVWRGGHEDFYRAQQATAAATAVEADAGKNVTAEMPVKWKSNALRHSYASYRFALTNDAGRVAGELGNSAAVVHRHYRELVKLADAKTWFDVKPETAPNVVLLSAAAST